MDQVMKSKAMEAELLKLIEELSDSEKKTKMKKKKRRKTKKHRKRRKKKPSRGSRKRREEDGPVDAPRKIPLDEKEQQIAKGLKVASAAYPTLDENVKSDWDPE
ncbi:BLVR domain-containing protein [Caenorhabditis elegans]|nr:BLVR domain-containing protein [Caenorhabditis elegans]CCD83534.1 BLVR domain-containing protein [Caenorhabditis elegans]|eukprot:NP_001033449.1 Uncharacterized protein CELE_Y54G2A.49 [Caenorhabditis elegans]